MDEATSATDAERTIAIDVALHPRLHTRSDNAIVIYIEPLAEAGSLLTALEDRETVRLVAGESWANEGAARRQLEETADSDLELPADCLRSAVEQVRAAGTIPVVELVAALPNARPACARVASLVNEHPDVHTIELCCATAGDAVSARAIYVAGVLCRILLDELELPAELTEAAGVAITVAAAQGGALSALAPSSGDLSGWLTFAATPDHVGVVPRIDPGELVARVG